MEKQIKLLQAVEDTLERVNVSGSDNMDRLLGCIQVIRSVKHNLNQMQKEAEENAEGGAGSVRKRNDENAATAI